MAIRALALLLLLVVVFFDRHLCVPIRHSSLPIRFSSCEIMCCVFTTFRMQLDRHGSTTSAKNYDHDGAHSHTMRANMFLKPYSIFFEPLPVDSASSVILTCACERETANNVIGRTCAIHQKLIYHEGKLRSRWMSAMSSRRDA